MPKGVAYDAVVFQYSVCGVAAVLKVLKVLEVLRVSGSKAACFRGFKSFNVYSGVISSLPFLMTAW